MDDKWDGNKNSQSQQNGIQKGHHGLISLKYLGISTKWMEGIVNYRGWGCGVY